MAAGDCNETPGLGAAFGEAQSEMRSDHANPAIAAMHVGLDPSILPRHELTVRNRLEPLAIFVVDEIESIVKELSAVDKR